MKDYNFNNLFSLEGKCAVVFGGKGKVGLPMVEALAEFGATLYIVSPFVDPQDKIFKEYQDNNLNIYGICADQSNESQVFFISGKNKK